MAAMKVQGGRMVPTEVRGEVSVDLAEGRRLLTQARDRFRSAYHALKASGRSGSAETMALAQIGRDLQEALNKSGTIRLE